MTEQMQAIIVREHGGPEALRVERVPRPVAKELEAVVRIEAAGVNFLDVYQREGIYPIRTPFTPGNEGAGTVVEVGSAVRDLRPGDRVAYANVRGSFAGFARVPADRLVPIPDSIGARDAAAAMLQGMTAHYLTHATYPVREGDTVLVHAAAGGVGLLLCQMARRRGARVIGTTSSPDKAVLARDAGAHEVILYTEVGFVDEVARLTGGRGVDVVYDSVGRDTFDGSLESLRPRGMLVLFGGASGPVPPFDPQVLNRRGSLYLTRPSLGPYIATREELLERAGDVLSAMASGELRLRIDSEYPLGDAPAAFMALESRRTSGKLLLIP